jgi:hypothetical protein
VLRRVTLPEQAFPTAIDPDNAIRSFYKTNLIYPAIGPAASASYVLRFSRVVRHLALASSVVRRLREYRARYQELPSIARHEPLLDPRVRNPGGYIERFVTSVRRNPLLEASGQLALRLRVEVGMAPTEGPAVMARTFAGIPMQPARSALSREARKSLDTALLLRALSVPNDVFSDLFDAGVLQAEGDIIRDAAVLRGEAPHEPIIAALAKRQPEVDQRLLKAASPLVRMAVRRVARHHGTELLRSFDKSPEVRNGLTRYLLGRLGALADLPHTIFPHPGGFIWPGDEDDGQETQREWAFQRSEELHLALGTPVLRGPVIATPVAPRSRHTRIETESSTITETTTAASERQTRTAESRQVISASAFSSALDGLTESGIADAAAFEQNSTLLSTLNEERHTIVDTVAREITSGVESGRTWASTLALGRRVKYRTNGKDQKLSTTELGFQVVVPAEATVRLRDVGLAWCPRVPLPFSPLRDNVRLHESEQRDAYITQYYVPLPVAPALKSDVIREDYFEFWIRGRKNRQKKNFSRLIPLYGDGFIDLNEITIKHRNGTWDDAEEMPWDGDIPYNYDDLEHAAVSLENLALSADGQTLTGTGVLETHDPEYLNVSWLGVTVPIRSYTDETRAALAAFEQAKQEHDLKLQAVQSRATQFGRLKRDELIDQYERTMDLRREAFRGLIRRVCLDVPPSHHSYFEEVLSRCINWADAKMALESEDMADLPFRELPPDHFMNTPGARFFLPIQKGAEKLFFDTLERTGHDYYNDSAATIREQLNDFREQIEEWTENDAPELVLDTFTTEMVIGHHLEAVLSETEFANEPA